ncbi:hypothetical protein BC940DRAFT_113842 [Gongronella butleri]|nr:hypothetical protein BC940DRAFT_113842 [Gongronella butleri]
MVSLVAWPPTAPGHAPGHTRHFLMAFLFQLPHLTRACIWHGRPPAVPARGPCAICSWTRAFFWGYTGALFTQLEPFVRPQALVGANVLFSLCFSPPLSSIFFLLFSIFPPSSFRPPPPFFLFFFPFSLLVPPFLSFSPHRTPLLFFYIHVWPRARQF